MVENRVLYQLFIVIFNLMAVEYIALYTHQALEQKSLTLDLAIAVLHSLQRAICCSHTHTHTHKPIKY